MTINRTVPHIDLLDQLTSVWRSGRPPHGVILTGSRGIGKARLARELAFDLLDIPGASGDTAHPDLVQVTPSSESASRTITVDQIRSACRQLQLTPARGGRRICIINAADDMTEESSNALLKTLEEPPEDATIIIVSHALGHVPATIRSRCSLIRVPTPSREEAIEILSGIHPDLDRTTVAALVDFAGNSPGIASNLVEQNVVEAYSALLEILKPIALERGELDRNAAHKFADAYGTKDKWDSTVLIFQQLLLRSTEIATTGNAPPRIAPGETKVLTGISKAAGQAGLASGWTIIEQIIGETRDRFLDQRYATLRLILAIEFIARPRKAA